LKTAFIIFLLSFSINSLAQIESPVKSVNRLNQVHFGFIENKGQVMDQHHQFNSSAKYILPLQQGMNVVLKKNAFSYDTYTATEDSAMIMSKTIAGRKDKKPGKITKKFHRVEVTFIGANPSPQVVAKGISSNAVYYYNAPINKIETHYYQTVTYKNLYPGIDLVFEAGQNGNQGNMEYYFVVRPNGDARTIKLQYKGAYHTTLKDEMIEVEVAKGIFKEKIPASYQCDNYPENIAAFMFQPQVKAQYKKLGENTYGFDISGYKKNKTIVIDPTPVLVWGTYYGEYLNDWGTSVAEDSKGNIFMGGASDNAANIATTGAYQTVMDGYTDAILGKFTNDGELLWMTYYGGSGQEDIVGLVIDKQNNVLALGSTFSDNNIATPGSYKQKKTSPSWFCDAYIVKFSNDGNRIWSTYFGGDSTTYGTAIAKDGLDNIYITGFTNSAIGIATAGAYQKSYMGGDPMNMFDGYIAKFDDHGAIAWSTYYGGYSSDGCYGIAADANANIYVTGETWSQTNIASTGGYQTQYGGGATDAFLVKFGSDGKRQWSTYYGGSGNEHSFAIATDTKGNIVFGGQTFSANGITDNGHQNAFGGDFDGFFVKFDKNGKRIWGSYYGGKQEEFIYGITCDPSDNIIITGVSSSADGIASEGSYQSSNSLQETTFIAKFSDNCIRKWGTYYGNGPGYGQGNAVIADSKAIYLASSTLFGKNIATCNAVQTTWAGNQDASLAKFVDNGTTTSPSVSISSNTNGSICPGTSVTFTALAVNAGPKTSFQWQVNGENTGDDTSVFSSNLLRDGDSIRCILAIESPCSEKKYFSNAIIMHYPQVKPLPEVNIAFIGRGPTVCEGSLVTVAALPINDPYYNSRVWSYRWLLNGEPAGSDSSNFSYNYPLQGDQITCILTDLSLCNQADSAVAVPVSINVKKVLQPIVKITLSANYVCAGMPVTFTTNGQDIDSVSRYQWYINGQSLGSNSSQFASAELSDNDKINCVVTMPPDGCYTNSTIASDTLTMHIYPLPILLVNPIDTTISPGASVQFKVTTTAPVATLIWTPATGLSDTAIADPVAQPNGTTAYKITARSYEGCETAKTATIHVFIKLQMPTAFSPNGDGVNDFFNIPKDALIDLDEFAVYDRWGNLVFKTKTRNKGWDGTANGIKLEAGTFVFVINGKVNDRKVIVKGTVTLIR
jgi:gliding motility-associated-like protein